MQEIKPDEVYNLAAMSHVRYHLIFQNMLQTLMESEPKLLESIRILGLEHKTRIYQASTSELYGKVQEVPKVNQHHSIQDHHTE